MKSGIFYIIFIFSISQISFFGCENKNDGVSNKNKYQEKEESSLNPAGNWVYTNSSGWEFYLTIMAKDEGSGNWFLNSDEIGTSNGSYKMTKSGNMTFYEEDGILVAKGRLTENTLYYDTPDLGSIPFRRK